MKEKILTYLLPFLMIIAGAFIRLLPHMPNFTPVAAIALLGGVYLPKRYAVVFPLLIMFISDLFLGFHSTILWVYGSFILITLLGNLIRKNINFAAVLTTSLISSFSFYLITNFGVWVSTAMYPKTFSGLMESFYMGIPFLRFTLLGDLFYNALFFGGFYLVSNFIFPKVFQTINNQL